jgi:hypothetical protein
MHTDKHRFLSWLYPCQSVSICGLVFTVRTTLGLIVNHAAICLGAEGLLNGYHAEMACRAGVGKVLDAPGAGRRDRTRYAHGNRGRLALDDLFRAHRGKA